MDNSQSLRSCFAEAETRRKTIESSLDSRAPDFQNDLVAAISRYEKCLEIADQVSLFSPNESLDDVSSADLQYFLIHYQIAQLVLRTNTNERKTILSRARKEFELYLKLLDSYDALSKEDFKIFEQYQENQASFSIIKTSDPASKRQMKINRFKEEKALKNKLDYLQQNPTALQNEDSTLRDLHLTHIALCTHQTFQSLESIAQEFQILALAPPALPENSQQTGQDSRNPNDQRPKDEYSERLDTSLSSMLANGKNGPILSKSGRPLRPFTILDSRQRLQQGVFRPDHNLPTMTIDEYLEEERRRGGIIEGGGPQSEVREEVNEDDMDRADEETMKARRWDEFKEENPRGSGNTMNMG